MGKRKKTDAVSAPERLDVATVEGLKPWLEHPLARAAGAVGELGDQPPLLALSGATLALGLLRRDARLANAGGRMIAAHLLATAIKTHGKNNIDRSRPRALIDRGAYKMKKGKSRDPALRSFPSGHTAGAVAVARAAARDYPEHRWPLYGAAALIGALQVPRRAHFPTDVLAGALVGLAAEAAVHGLGRLLARNLSRRPGGRELAGVAAHMARRDEMADIPSKEEAQPRRTTGGGEADEAGDDRRLAEAGVLGPAGSGDGMVGDLPENQDERHGRG